jgi:hypothetical protein
MRTLFVFFLFCSHLTATSQTVWFKGNLHTHSYWSDGDEFPEMIMDWYKTHGYQFVALSDHNTLAEGEKWKVIPKGKAFEDGFSKYLKKFGNQWVVHKRDTGRIQVKLKTYDEYKPLFEDKNFLIIRSEELTDRFEGKQVHMNATNIQTLIKPQGGASLQEVIQNNLNAIIDQRKMTGAPIMQHLNHPNFYYSITAQNIIDLDGERFFEVYNGHPLVYNYGDSIHPGTEQMWDEINIAYIKQGKPMLYGLGTDDSHNYHMFGTKYSNAGRGWVMVRAKSLTPESLIEAMEAGDFYATTGVTLTDVTFKNNELKISVRSEKGVKYRIDFIGTKKGESISSVLQSTATPSAGFKVTDQYDFVRAKVISDKKRTNPIEEDEDEVAWTQPVRVN